MRRDGRDQLGLVEKRIGSLANIRTNPNDVRFTPESGQCAARDDVRYGPKADITATAADILRRKKSCPLYPEAGA
jgi:hypothetical protein